MNIKNHLVDDAHLAIKMASVQAAGALTLVSVLQYVQASLLPAAQPFVPPQYWPLVSAVFGLLIIGARLWKQWRGPVGDAAAEAPADAAVDDGITDR